MPNNKLIDRVAPLEFQIFRGNSFSRTLILPESYPLPSIVSIKLYSGQGGRLLESASQPLITRTGRNLVITFSQTTNLPEVGYQETFFDSRKVWAGSVWVNRNTSLLATPDSGTVVLMNEQNVPLTVPYSGDFLTAQYRDEAQQAALQAQQYAEDAANASGNLVLVTASDSQSVTLVWGPSVQVQHITSPYPALQITFP